MLTTQYKAQTQYRKWFIKQSKLSGKHCIKANVTVKSFITDTDGGCHSLCKTSKLMEANPNSITDTAGAIVYHCQPKRNMQLYAYYSLRENWLLGYNKGSWRVQVSSDIWTGNSFQSCVTGLALTSSNSKQCEKLLPSFHQCEPGASSGLMLVLELS